MKTIAALLALALATAATARPADACGGYGSFVAIRESAVGVWPQLRTDREGQLHLTLSYPKFALSGDYLYMHDFVLERDAQLRRFERALAASGQELDVTVEEVKPGRWRVRSWKKQNAGA